MADLKKGAHLWG